MRLTAGGDLVKTVDIQQTSLDACVADAQSDRVVVTRGGSPVALVVGVEGLDEEQIQLGASDGFWRLISERRNEPTVDRASLERMIEEQNPS
jgi:antitoxin (DNA-binding transcriptional repressor) of toxin-antitoxin stability system